MLPSSLRLDLRAWPEFFTNPKIKKTPHLTFLWQGNPVQQLQVAVVVKKTFGGAVERVKIRRVIRSAIIRLWKTNPDLFHPSVGVVIIPRRPVTSQAECEREIASVFTQWLSA